MPFSPASPADAARTASGIAAFTQMGFRVAEGASFENQGYFAGSAEARRNDFISALRRPDIDALVGVRGGYGSNYLLNELDISGSIPAKIVLGFSDLTSLQIFLWQRARWVTFYGPMFAAGFDSPADPISGGEPSTSSRAVPTSGYDQESLIAALQNTDSGWQLDLKGEVLSGREARGRLLGGCLTLIETSIGTPWELDGDGAILILEDRGMKPWQVDRALMHLLQANMFNGVRGIVLGDFPECEPLVAGSPTVSEVCRRILAPLGIPIIFGAPVGHTTRPMITIPLGVSAQLSAKGEGSLEILEPAVVV